MAQIRKLDEQSFEAEVLSGELPVLVDFTAAWCSPCRAMLPVLDQLAAEQAGRLKVASIDAGRYPALAARFGVHAFPTLIAFRGGAEVGRHVGLTTVAKIARLFES